MARFCFFARLYYELDQPAVSADQRSRKRSQ